MWSDRRQALITSALVLAAGCGARQPEGYDEVRRALRPPPPSAAPALEGEVRLETVVAAVLAANPDLGEARERALAALERSRAAGGLPDAQLKYEQWGVPLDRPVALGSADTLMIGVRQEIPAPGSLGAEARAAFAEAKVEAQATRARELDLVLQAKHAYHAYVLADWEVKLHAEHLELTQGLVDAVTGAYRANRATQQDVLLAELEAVRLHNEVIAARQRLASARALLNALMARPAAAPLGPPAGMPPIQLDTSQLEDGAARPELRRADLAIERDRASEDAARRRAEWPTIMLGADYMLMPSAAEAHTYGLMASITLPWLNGKNRAAVRAAEHEVRAAARAADAARNMVRYEVADALARYQAARESFGLVDTQLLPQATRAYESSRAAFATPQGSSVALLQSFRVYLDARLERARALARLATAAADLERAAGVDLPRSNP